MQKDISNTAPVKRYGIVLYLLYKALGDVNYLTTKEKNGCCAYRPDLPKLFTKTELILVGVSWTAGKTF